MMLDMDARSGSCFMRHRERPWMSMKHPSKISAETPPGGQLRLESQIRELRAMPIPALRDHYFALFGRMPPIPYESYIVRRIIWKLQAKASGDLSERALKRV